MARRSPLVVTTLVVAAGIVLSSCGGGDGRSSPDDATADGVSSVTLEPPGPPVSGGILRYGLGAETDGWHPGLSRWAPSGVEVARAVFDTLGAFDENLEVQPFLAESVEHSDDYTEWTVRMRPGVVFHDGSPADGAAVKANFDWHRTSQLTSVPFALVEQVDLVDDLTVTLTMSEPWVTFPIALTTQVGILAQPAMLDDPDGARNPVGTGPFVFESWSPDAELIVSRNDGYWQEGRPYLDGIEFRPITDTASRIAALDAGEVDLVQLSTPANIIRATEQAEAGEVQIFANEASEVAESFVQLNTQAPPLDDIRVRRALAHATNRELYVDTIADGLFELADSPYHAASRWHTDVDYPDYDLDAAGALVEEYEAENGPISFELTGGTTSRNNRALLQQMWADAGMDVELTDVEQSQLIAKVATGDYQATTWSQFASPNPVGDSIWWVCESVSEPGTIGLNFARHCNDEMEEAFTAARQEPDLDAQKPYYDVVQRELARSVPYVWLFHGQGAVGGGTNVWDVTDWTLPDGQTGLPLEDSTHPLFQVWLSSS